MKINVCYNKYAWILYESTWTITFYLKETMKGDTDVKQVHLH